MNITFLFYNGMTALDAIGPHEILARLPGATIYRASLQSGSIQAGAGLTLITEYALSDITETDILVVPGGGSATSLRNYPEILTWIKKIHTTTTWTTSVCTGSLILGAAGVLSGVQATTHWAVMDRLETYGAIPTHKRIVESGKIITAAGVSAGIDMALSLASKIAGQSVAESLQLAIEYDPEPPFNAGSPEKAPSQIVDALRARLLEKFDSQ